MSGCHSAREYRYPNPGATLETDCELAGFAGAEKGVREVTASQGPTTPGQCLPDNQSSIFKKGRFCSQWSWALSQEGHVAPPKTSFRLRSCHLCQVGRETLPVVSHKSRAAYFRKPRIGPSQGHWAGFGPGDQDSYATHPFSLLYTHTYTHAHTLLHPWPEDYSSNVF